MSVVATGFHHGRQIQPHRSELEPQAPSRTEDVSGIQLASADQVVGTQQADKQEVTEIKLRPIGPVAIAEELLQSAGPTSGRSPRRR